MKAGLNHSLKLLHVAEVLLVKVPIAVRRRSRNLERHSGRHDAGEAGFAIPSPASRKQAESALPNFQWVAEWRLCPR